MNFHPDELPWSNEAEQSVLGALLLDNGAWDRAGDILLRQHFFSGAHGVIWDAIGGLVNACKPADVISVADRVRSMDGAGELGSLIYLNQLAQSVPSAANIRRHAEIVLEHWKQRALIEEADKAMQVATGKGTADEKLDTIATGFSALERHNVAQGPTGMDSIVVDVIDHLNEMHEGGAPQGWNTRLPSLNKMLGGGFHPGLVYLLGARPAMGKSSLALWWETTLSVNDGLRCVYLSQEMGKRELGQRAVASVGGVSYARIRTGTLNDDEWGRMTEAVEKLGRCTFMVDEQAGLTGNDIRIKARYMKGLNLLVLDYVQLCRGAEEGAQNRNSELEVISRGIKQLAKEMHCAVLVLSALNRKVDERARQRPIMSDFKDCGALEADADVILTLFPIRAADSTGMKIMGMDVLKQRQGPVGSVALNFWGELMQWGESEFEVAELLKPERSKGGNFE